MGFSETWKEGRRDRKKKKRRKEGRKKESKRERKRKRTFFKKILRRKKGKKEAFLHPHMDHIRQAAHSSIQEIDVIATRDSFTRGNYNPQRGKKYEYPRLSSKASSICRSICPTIPSPSSPHLFMLFVVICRTNQLLDEV